MLKQFKGFNEKFIVLGKSSTREDVFSVRLINNIVNKQA
ncbi:hypothetical protein HMPREF0492_0513 [Lactobacillus acidophilus ATCC 4796]|nr:hypothetical protein LA14_0150 [Lactobacillus acidophilus La-14]AJP45625.1 hypothetical protein SD55_0147 [Lactobacillus acidophilus]EEJ76603.1 hypothetical protein HMPREF0492_0513 [Lactobacillus acidophilus ATCC 4796]CDF66951.1 Putative uncharacterized protein [Lactobacillus acidophilus DSM 20079 = JCM 1132 = NBRC 13951 = CIP 76.13]CDF68629.1 Putative uncharacterized protein [Lactobacillus acidophilus CIRM-BIA 442]CDF72387.1 Putative uncharacterized protein [Lactobacillus acidophilus CIRM-